MKKLLIGIMTLFLVVGCGNMMNTPTKKVEDFLGKYQTVHSDVMTQLDDVIKDAGTMSDKQKETYRDMMKKQYQNMSYKIKDETVDGDNATVETEIEVYHYGDAISKAESYLVTNRDEFFDKVTNDVDKSKFLDYKIEQIKKVKDKVKYTINFSLTKVDGKWKLDDINDVDRQKIHGLYY